MELIAVCSGDGEVHERPLLIFPPWINKFYIIDLRPENSFVRWLVGQGYTVFLVSWVNPDAQPRPRRASRIICAMASSPRWTR